MVFDDEEMRLQSEYWSNYAYSPSPSPPRRTRTRPTRPTGGEEKEKTHGAAQPKTKVSLGHLLMMVANGDLEKDGELRDPWTTPLLETPPEEVEDCLGAYVDMDDFLTKPHEKL